MKNTGVLYGPLIHRQVEDFLKNTPPKPVVEECEFARGLLYALPLAVATWIPLLAVISAFLPQF